MKEKQKIIIIGGPTGSGKTALALQIAKAYNGELINADSRQIYKYLDVGTNKGKLTPRDNLSLLGHNFSFLLEGVPIHLINFLDPNVRFSVFEFQRYAKLLIEEISMKGGLPIIIGGTGLYIDSIIHNYVLENSNTSLLDADINYENLEIEELQELATQKVPGVYSNLNNSDKNNPRRIIRLLQKAAKGFNLQKTSDECEYDYLFLYPKFSWEELQRTIENRAAQMFLLDRELGESIVTETAKVLEMGFDRNSIALHGIGYRDVIGLIDGEITESECIDRVKTAHKQYAKRQKTWFEGAGRNYPLDRVVNFIEAKEKIENFLKGS